MSGTENSMQELFARAACVACVATKWTRPAITMPEYLLQALDILPSESGNTDCDPETANRAHLLMAASRFARVFELASPDAPGLFSFGAQFDPALANSLHDGKPDGRRFRRRPDAAGSISGLHRRGSRVSVSIADRKRSVAQTRHRRLRPANSARRRLELVADLVGTPHATGAGAFVVSRHRGSTDGGRSAGCRPTSACAVRRRSANSRRRFR